MDALTVLAVWLVLGLVAAIVIVSWARKLWIRRRALSRPTLVAAAVVAASAMAGALGTVVGLVKAFGAVGAKAKSRKAPE